MDHVHLRFLPPQHSTMSFTQSLWCSILWMYGSCVLIWLEFQTRIMASRPVKHRIKLNRPFRRYCQCGCSNSPAEYNRPLFWSNCNAFTPFRCRFSSASRITNDTCIFFRPTWLFLFDIIMLSRPKYYWNSLRQKGSCTENYFHMKNRYHLIFNQSNNKIRNAEGKRTLQQFQCTNWCLMPAVATRIFSPQQINNKLLHRFGVYEIYSSRKWMELLRINFYVYSLFSSAITKWKRIWIESTGLCLFHF